MTWLSESRTRGHLLRSRRGAALLTATITVALAALAGCGGGNRLTLTHAQAVSHVERLVHETAATLQPSPTLKLYPGLSGDTNCTNSAGGQSNLVNVSRSYILDGFPASDNQMAGEKIRSFWEKRGYHITKSAGVGTGTPSISATTNDSFLLALESNSQGTLMLVASSPCAQPDSAVSAGG